MRRTVAVPTALAGMLALGFVVNPEAAAQNPRGARGASGPHAAKAAGPGANVARLETNVNRLLARQNHLVTGNEFSVNRRDGYSQTLHTLWSRYAQTKSPQVLQEIRKTAQLRKIVETNLAFKKSYTANALPGIDSALNRSLSNLSTAAHSNPGLLDFINTARAKSQANVNRIDSILNELPPSA